MKKALFGHTLKDMSWIVSENLIPKNSDDVITIISTAWSEPLKKGETMWMKLKTKSYFEFRDGLNMKYNDTEEKTKNFHMKIVKEAKNV